MPKLDGTHMWERLQKRVDELEAGQEVAARDIKALLTPLQITELDAAWVNQTLLRKQKGALGKAGEAAAGWKTKRELRLEALKLAIIQVRRNEVAAWKRKAIQSNARQLRIYFDALDEAEAERKDKHAATTFANNELTRAGLRRLDGVLPHPDSARRRKMEALERELTVRGMDSGELEEFEMVEAAAAKERGLKAPRVKKRKLTS